MEESLRYFSFKVGVVVFSNQQLDIHLILSSPSQSELMKQPKDTEAIKSLDNQKADDVVRQVKYSYQIMAKEAKTLFALTELIKKQINDIKSFQFCDIPEFSNETVKPAVDLSPTNQSLTKKMPSIFLQDVNLNQMTVTCEESGLQNVIKSMKLQGIMSFLKQAKSRISIFLSQFKDCQYKELETDEYYEILSSFYKQYPNPKEFLIESLTNNFNQINEQIRVYQAILKLFRENPNAYQLYKDILNMFNTNSINEQNLKDLDLPKILSELDNLYKPNQEFNQHIEELQNKLKAFRKYTFRVVVDALKEDQMLILEIQNNNTDKKSFPLIRLNNNLYQLKDCLLELNSDRLVYSFDVKRDNLIVTYTKEITKLITNLNRFTVENQYVIYDIPEFYKKGILGVSKVQKSENPDKYPQLFVNQQNPIEISEETLNIAIQLNLTQTIVMKSFYQMFDLNLIIQQLNNENSRNWLEYRKDILLFFKHANQQFLLDNVEQILNSFCSTDRIYYPDVIELFNNFSVVSEKINIFKKIQIFNQQKNINISREFIDNFFDSSTITLSLDQSIEDQIRSIKDLSAQDEVLQDIMNKVIQALLLKYVERLNEHNIVGNILALQVDIKEQKEVSKKYSRHLVDLVRNKKLLNLKDVSQQLSEIETIKIIVGILQLDNSNITLIIQNWIEQLINSNKLHLLVSSMISLSEYYKDRANTKLRDYTLSLLKGKVQTLKDQIIDHKQQLLSDLGYDPDSIFGLFEKIIQESNNLEESLKLCSALQIDISSIKQLDEMINRVFTIQEIDQKNFEQVMLQNINQIIGYLEDVPFSNSISILKRIIIKSFKTEEFSRRIHLLFEAKNVILKGLLRISKVQKQRTNLFTKYTKNILNDESEILVRKFQDELSTISLKSLINNASYINTIQITENGGLQILNEHIEKKLNAAKEQYFHYYQDIQGNEDDFSSFLKRKLRTKITNQLQEIVDQDKFFGFLRDPYTEVVQLDHNDEIYRKVLQLVESEEASANEYNWERIQQIDETLINTLNLLDKQLFVGRILQMKEDLAKFKKYSPFIQKFRKNLGLDEIKKNNSYNVNQQILTIFEQNHYDVISDVIVPMEKSSITNSILKKLKERENSPPIRILIHALLVNITDFNQILFQEKFNCFAEYQHILTDKGFLKSTETKQVQDLLFFQEEKDTHFSSILDFFKQNSSQINASLNEYFESFGIDKRYTEKIKKTLASHFYSENETFFKKVSHLFANKGQQQDLLFPFNEQDDLLEKIKNEFNKKTELTDDQINTIFELSQIPNFSQNIGNFLDSSEILKETQKNIKFQEKFINLRNLNPTSDQMQYLAQISQFDNLFERLANYHIQCSSNDSKNKDNNEKLTLKSFLQKINKIINKQLGQYKYQQKLDQSQKYDEWKAVVSNFFILENMINKVAPSQKYIKQLSQMVVGEVVFSINQKGGFSYKITNTSENISYDEEEVQTCIHFLQQNSAILQNVSEATEDKQMNELKTNKKNNTLITKFQEVQIPIFDIILAKQQILNKLQKYGHFYLEDLIKKSSPLTLIDKSVIEDLNNVLLRWKNGLNNLYQQYPLFSLIGYKYNKLAIRYLLQNDFHIQENDIETREQINQINMLVGNGISKVEQKLTLEQLDNLLNYSNNNLPYSDNPKKQILYIHRNLLNIFIQNTFRNIYIVRYKHVKEALKFLISEIDSIENLNHYYYLFYDRNIEEQDIDLFISRYTYYKEQKPMKFFIVLNSQPNEQSLVQQLQTLVDNNQSDNLLFILTNEEHYSDSFAKVQRAIPPQEISEQQQLNLKALLRLSNVEFISSSQPCIGKSFYIDQQCKEKGLHKIRLTTNGESSKENIIKQLSLQKKRFLEAPNTENNDQMNFAYHIDLYESSYTELNFLLFELIFLRSLNFKSNLIEKLEDEDKIYIEISNTHQNTFKKQMVLSTYFPQKSIEFNPMTDFVLIYENYLNKHIPYTVLKYLSNSYGDKKIQPTNQEIEYHAVDVEEFRNIIEKHFILEQKDPINLNYSQIINFISMFGQQMQLLETHLNDIILQKSKLTNDIIQMLLNYCLYLSKTHILDKDISQQDIHSFDQELDYFTERIQDSIKFSDQQLDFIIFFEKNLIPFMKDVSKHKGLVKQIMKLKQGNEIFSYKENEDKNQQQLQTEALRILNSQNDQFKMHQEQNNEEKNEPTDMKDVFSMDYNYKLYSLIMRLQAGIPIILMGEAGTSKSHLVNYLASNFDCGFKKIIIHQGVQEQEILDLVQAKYYDDNKKTIIFFDEINTNSTLSGLFKEILLDRHIKGVPIHKNIILIAAMNPYKKKCEQQQNLMKAQIHVGIRKEYGEQKQCRLEFTVSPFHESFKSYVWNFGQLSKECEAVIIKQMILECIEKLKGDYSSLSKTLNGDLQDLVNVIQNSHQIIRNILGNSSCSIRDIKRFCQLLLKVPEFLSNCPKNLYEDSEPQGLLRKSYDFFNSFFFVRFDKLVIYLSLYITYYVRIPYVKERKQYLQSLVSSRVFSWWGDIHVAKDKIQSYLLTEVITGQKKKGIAQNKMLKENLFILFICIVFKIPVCLIGQPGSSKSLSIKLLMEAMKGVNSKSGLLKQYPTLMKQYYQGQIQSKSENIETVFHQAKEAQKQYDEGDENSLAVVYFDEIGLAEISPHNPLKVLHKTLEKQKVAVACISNWPLDASKMNRMLAFYCLDYDEEDLQETAKSILSEIFTNQKTVAPENPNQQINNNNVLDFFQQKGILNKFSQAYLEYMEIVKETKDSKFHGLRDYFSWAKQFSQQLADYNNQNKNDKDFQGFEVDQNLERTFQRNFSGLKSSDNQRKISKQIFNVIQPLEYQPRLFIRSNIKEKSNIFLTRNLIIIADSVYLMKEELMQSFQGKEDNIMIITGTGFDEQNSKKGTLKVLYKIMECVTKGIKILLYNFKSIYQNLYELLDQNYDYYMQSTYCKIYYEETQFSVEVHKDFKCILLVDKEEVNSLDGPLLNRFEKHIILQKDFINKNLNNSNKAVQKQVQSQMNQTDITIDEKQFNSLTNILSQPLCPMHKIINEAEIKLCFYLQFKRDKVKPIKDEQLNIINTKLFNLVNFNQVAIPHSNPIFQGYQQNYINSEFMRSLDQFLEEKNKYVNRQVNLYQVYTQDNFDLISPKYSRIMLSEIDSSENLESFILKFLNSVNISASNSSQKNILLILTDISSSGKDNFSKLDFATSSISTLVNKYLENIDEDKKIYFYSIVLLIRVEQEFRMVPVRDYWEYYYLDNLSSEDSHFGQLNKEDNDNQEKLEKVKLSYILGNDKTIEFIDLIDLFINSDNIFFDTMIRQLKYEDNQKEDRETYLARRLNQIKQMYLIQRQQVNEIISRILNRILHYKENNQKSITYKTYIQQYLYKKYPNSTNFYSTFIKNIRQLISKATLLFLHQLEKKTSIKQFSECNFEDKDADDIIASIQIPQQEAKSQQEEFEPELLTQKLDLNYRQSIEIDSSIQKEFAKWTGLYKQDFNELQAEIKEKVNEEASKNLSLSEYFESKDIDKMKEDFCLLNPQYKREVHNLFVNNLLNNYRIDDFYKFLTSQFLNRRISREFQDIFDIVEYFIKKTKITNKPYEIMFLFDGQNYQPSGNLQDTYLTEKLLFQIIIKNIYQHIYNALVWKGQVQKNYLSIADSMDILAKIRDCTQSKDSLYFNLADRLTMIDIYNVLGFIDHTHSFLKTFDLVKLECFNFDDIFHLQFESVITLKRHIQEVKGNKRKTEEFLKVWWNIMETLLWNVVEQGYYTLIDVNLLMNLLNLEEVDKEIHQKKVSLSFQVFAKRIMSQIVKQNGFGNIRDYLFLKKTEEQYKNLRRSDDVILDYPFDSFTLKIFSEILYQNKEQLQVDLSDFSYQELDNPISKVVFLTFTTNPQNQIELNSEKLSFKNLNHLSQNPNINHSQYLESQTEKINTKYQVNVIQNLEQILPNLAYVHQELFKILKGKVSKEEILWGQIRYTESLQQYNRKDLISFIQKEFKESWTQFMINIQRENGHPLGSEIHIQNLVYSSDNNCKTFREMMEKLIDLNNSTTKKIHDMLSVACSDYEDNFLFKQILDTYEQSNDVKTLNKYKSSLNTLKMLEIFTSFESFIPYEVYYSENPETDKFDISENKYYKLTVFKQLLKLSVKITIIESDKFIVTSKKI